MADQPQFILGSGEVFSPATEKDTASLRQLGVHEATAPELKHEYLRQQYSGWEHILPAAAVGVASALLPGGMSSVAGLENLVSPDAAKTTADYVEGLRAGHPYASGAGLVGGAVAGGALTKGLGLVAGSAVAAGQSAAMAVDDLALKHIQDPEGAEKMGATIGLAALLGAGINAVTHGLFTALGGGALARTGEKLETRGAASIAAKSAIGNPGVQDAIAAKGMTDEVEAFAQKHGLMSLPKKQVAAKLADITKAAEGAMNEAKAVSAESMPAANQIKFAEKMKEHLAGVGDKYIARAQSATTVGDLHQLRIRIDKSINWADPTSPAAQKLIAARNLVDQQIDAVFEHNLGLHPEAMAEQATRWKVANADYAAAETLRGALKQSDATGKSWIGAAARKVSQAGATGAVFSGMNGNVAGAAAGGAAYAGGKAVSALADSTAIPQTVRGLGKFLQGFDKIVVQTVAKGLETGGMSSKNQVGALAAHELLTLNDYTNVSTSVKWASENPTRAVPMMAQKLEEHGVPGPMIDSAVPQNIKAMQYLKTVAPQSPWIGRTVAPTPWQPSLAQKAMYIDRANAVANPLWALANPSKTRVEAVRTVYPILAQKVALIAAQEAAQRPDMLPAARQWSSQITGQSASVLSSPQAQAVLAGLDAQSQQSQQSREQQRKQSNPGGSTINPSRLDRMSDNASK